MSRVCKCCIHPDRELIDIAIVSGSSNRIISAQYGVSISSVQRHRSHIPETLAKVQEQAVVNGAEGLLNMTVNLLQEAQDITRESRSSGDLKTALFGIGRVQGIIELLLKVEMSKQQSTAGQGLKPGRVQFVQISVQERDD